LLVTGNISDTALLIVKNFNFLEKKKKKISDCCDMILEDVGMLDDINHT